MTPEQSVTPTQFQMDLPLPLIRKMLGTLVPKQITKSVTFHGAYNMGGAPWKAALLGAVGAQLWPSRAWDITAAAADCLQMYAEAAAPQWGQVYGQDHLSPLCVEVRKAIALATKEGRLQALNALLGQIRVLQEATIAYPGGEIWYREDNGRESCRRYPPVPAAIPTAAPPAHVGYAQMGLAALRASVCASISLEVEGPIHWEVAHDAAATLAGVLVRTPSTDPIHARIERRLDPVFRALPEQPEGVVVHPGMVHRRAHCADPDAP